MAAAMWRPTGGMPAMWRGNAARHPRTGMDMPKPQSKTAIPCGIAVRSLRLETMVRSRGLEPPLLSELPPQGSASTSSATTATASWRRPSPEAGWDVTDRCRLHKCPVAACAKRPDNAAGALPRPAPNPVTSAAFRPLRRGCGAALLLSNLSNAKSRPTFCGGAARLRRLVTGWDNVRC